MTGAPAASVYDAFADDYHWLYDDRDLRLGTATPGVRAALADLPGGARILDVACGIGVDAAALARSGFDVTASDGSAPMVEATRRCLAAQGLSASVLRSRWTDLDDHIAAHDFEAVLCTGNSMAHAADEGAMVGALRAFATRLVPGGRLVLDTHNWEVLAERGDTLVHDPVSVDRDGARCRRTYRWSWRTRPWTATLDIVLSIRRRGTTLRSHRVVLHPFTTTELRTRLRAAGFVDIGLDAHPDEDRYAVVARVPGRT